MTVFSEVPLRIDAVLTLQCCSCFRGMWRTHVCIGFFGAGDPRGAESELDGDASCPFV